MKGPPVGVLLVACIVDTRLLLRNSDVKGEACGKGKGVVEKARPGLLLEEEVHKV